MKMDRAHPLIVAFTDTHTPRQAAAAMTGEGSAAIVCGVYFNAHRTELFENDTILLNAEQPLLSAGAFVAIAWERNELRVEVNGSALIVPHAEPVERHHFCMAFMDVHMYPHPCWTLRRGRNRRQPASPTTFRLKHTFRKTWRRD